MSCGAYLPSEPVQDDEFGRNRSPQYQRPYYQQTQYQYGQSPQPYQAAPSTFSLHYYLGEELKSYETKNVALGLGFIMTIIGFFVGIYMFYLFPTLPILALILFYITFFCPLIGTVLIAVGYLRTGTVFLGIGSVLMIPIGLIGAFGARIAWKLSKVAKIQKTYNLQLPPEIAYLIKLSRKSVRIACMVFIIIMLIIPPVVYASFMDQPQVRIVDVSAPSFIYGDSFDVTIKLTNIGSKVAIGDDIKISIELSDDEHNFEWTQGDLYPNSEKEQECKIYTTSNVVVEKVTVYYKGDIHDSR
jgi:virulence-associated protein VapD